MRKLEAWVLRQASGDLPVDLPASAVASMLDPLIAMAMDGLGIACLPDFIVRQHLERGTLVAILADAVCGFGGIDALWLPARQA
jgi:DNA-binding transcriptional LysR family regulator